MDFENQVVITNNQKISAVYFGLLQNGYDFYSIERDEKHVNSLRRYLHMEEPSAFFGKSRQNTCDVYPFWPRGAMMETATFFLDSEMNSFADQKLFHSQIMSAENIKDTERDSLFWSWIEAFPSELKKVVESDSFREYWSWECEWIQTQNKIHQEDLGTLAEGIAFCKKHYPVKISNVKVVLSAVKCVYSSDYHVVGDSFICSSGRFNVSSVIHEFLHQVVHSEVIENKGLILSGKRKYEGIDPSYFLGSDDKGFLNAFEEYLVRALTQKVMNGSLPADLGRYIREIL